ncbi:hypothetical protein K1719_030049 [Acacia pycnantha]|nr:hypothetical protein K1719_030049 [Acacia pycnantha]
MEAFMLFLTFFFFLSSFPLFHCQPDREFWECQPSPCGKVGNISYPFWSEESSLPRHCDRSPEFKLNCPQHKDDYPSIKIGSQTFNVTLFDLESHKMTLMRTDFVYHDCCSKNLSNTNVSTVFQYDDERYVKNVTLFYNCSSDYSAEGFKFACQPPTSCDSNYSNYAFWSEYVVNELQYPDCKRRIQVPVSIEPDVQPQRFSQILEKALDDGFGVKYKVDESCQKCWDSGGRCGSNDMSPFICYCRDGHHPLQCPDSSRGIAIKNKVIIVVVSAVVVSGAIGLLLLSTNNCCCKIKSWRRRIGVCMTSEVDQKIEAFIRNHGALALTRYKFADVKKMANSFKNKLGQDESFCPKISYFGLAKLCPKKESTISISEAIGTVGYLAPGVWNRNIGGVSQKSDVYSYGMMLLDMVGGRKNMTVKTNCSTDKYFPDYIYDQLEQDGSLGCNRANNTGENDIAKRMTIVALWCIQTFPSH